MGILKEMQRAHAHQIRAQRQAQAAAYRHHQQLQRDAERAMKEAQRAAGVNERERKRLYAEARTAEVAAMNADLQYRNTVDVSSVRDLYGTVQSEGASKGILVTTSGYGATSYEFASGKPLELIDGSNLLFLLAEHAEAKARIDPSELD